MFQTSTPIPVNLSTVRLSMLAATASCDLGSAYILIFLVTLVTNIPQVLLCRWHVADAVTAIALLSIALLVEQDLFCLVIGVRYMQLLCCLHFVFSLQVILCCTFHGTLFCFSRSLRASKTSHAATCCLIRSHTFHRLSSLSRSSWLLSFRWHPVHLRCVLA
jgi:hypothetical protein